MAIPAGDSIVLQWTSTDNSVALFILERGIDKAHLFPIISIRPQAPSASAMEYTWIDPRPANGPNYYHLKVIDHTGRSRYSAIRPVFSNVRSTELEVRTYSDGSALDVLFPDGAEVRSVILCQHSGQLVMELPVSPGAAMLRIGSSALLEGLYSIVACMADGTELSVPLNANGPMNKAYTSALE
jgi:hypothetical protein